MHKCYQVRTYLSSQMIFLQTQGTSITGIYQKAEHVYQVTTLNEFINKG